MDRVDFQEALRERPFAPTEVSLTDGRIVLVRHPKQVMVTRQRAIFGLDHNQGRKKRLRTTGSAERSVTDILMVGFPQIESDRSARKRKGSNPRRSGK